MKKKYTFLSYSYLLLTLVGCSPFVHKHGFNQTNFDVKSIAVGVDTKNSISERFGSPSTTSIFPTDPATGGSKWYYIAKETEVTAFFKPETVAQKSIIITFDKSEKVSDVKVVEGEAEVELNPNTTENTGYQSSALRDIFGTFGRYSGKKSGNTSAS